MFSSVSSKQTNLDKALDQLTNKYGAASITRASRLDIKLNNKKEKNEA